MKFLLVAINAKYIHSNLAVYSLKAFAEKYGNNNNEIEIAEYTINQYSDDILRDIYKRKPDAVGFSCYIWNIGMVKEIVRDYKKICPNVDVWVGGPEVSYNVEQVLRENEAIDYVMYGEGELTFKEVMDKYNFNGISIDDLKDILGIGYRKSKSLEHQIFESETGILDCSKKQRIQIIINKPQKPVDMSDIPFVYKEMKDFENKIIYYETSRGCPFSCSYCLSSIDKRLRFRSLDLVKKELQFFIDNNTNQVKFVDRTFNCNKKHAMEIWSYIKKHDNGVTNFHFEIAADLMTEEEIALISDMRPGLIQLEIGVQSTNEKTLEAINRKTDIEKIAEITEKIHHSGNIHQHLDLIAGLPYENYESFKRSFDQVYAMKPDQFQLGFLKVLYGSMMKENSEKYGMAYSGRAPYEVLKTNWVSFDDILKLKEVEAVVEIYYNSFQFENTIRKLSELYESPFELYEQLGSFYQKHSENGEKHSRVKRYELLLNFIKKRNFEENIQWEELLTKDFYLRENAKSRPGFSKNIEKYKHQIREFFKGEEVRTILTDYEDYDSKQLEKMTHVEVFGINEDNLTYILFDYKHRNPLNKQAKLINITKQIKR